MPLKKTSGKKLLPIFAAFCFFLSAVELLIPKPLPFFRLGLANLPLLLALDVFSLQYFFLLTIIKAVGQSLINGTLFSYAALMSLAGSLFSAVAMYLLRRIPRRHISFIGIALAGAFASNTAQLLLARVLIFGHGTVYIAVPLFIIGCITAVGLGAFANEFAAGSTWYELVRADSYELPETPVIEAGSQHVRLRLFAGVVLLLLTVSIPALIVRALILSAALILCVCAKVKIRVLYLVVTGFAIILFNVYPPVGKIVFSIGAFHVTVGALSFGLQKMLVFESLVYISRWMLQYPIQLPGRMGRVLTDSFGFFKRLERFKSNFNPKHPIITVDEILLAAGE